MVHYQPKEKGCQMHWLPLFQNLQWKLRRLQRKLRLRSLKTTAAASPAAALLNLSKNLPYQHKAPCLPRYEGGGFAAGEDGGSFLS